MTERETILNIFKRLNILTYEGLDFIEGRVPGNGNKEIVEVWFDKDGKVDAIFNESGANE